MYDLIIVGLGAAGISAAIYAKRSNLKVLCLEKGMPGGIINYIDKIDNYPGFPNISGADLSYKLYEHLMSIILKKTKIFSKLVLKKQPMKPKKLLSLVVVKPEN